MFLAGSFRKYSDMKNQEDDLESGEGAANDATQLDRFMLEVELIKEDVKTMELLGKRLNESNEESRTIHLAAKMKELRALMDSDANHVLMFAKSIIKRIADMGSFERLSNNNPSAGSSIDQSRISVLMGLGQKIRNMMDEFQGLRARNLAAYKETVEHKYFSITGERKFIEAIENLVTTGEIEYRLTEAIEDHGMDPVLDFIAEILERQEGSKNLQRNLVELHQTFLDATAHIEGLAQKMANGGGGGGGGGGHQVARGNSFLKPTLLDQPDDYDREAKRRATVGLIFAVCLLFMIIIPLYVAESLRDLE